MVFNAERALEAPLGAEDRRSYQNSLNHLAANSAAENGARVEKWGRIVRNGIPGFDTEGRPILRIRLGEENVSVGVAASNLFATDAPEQFTEQLLEARLHAELRRGNPPKASESDITRDWNLLQRAMNGADGEAVARWRRPSQSGGQVRPERAGNQP